MGSCILVGSRDTQAAPPLKHRAGGVWLNTGGTAVERRESSSSVGCHARRACAPEGTGAS